MTTIGPVMLDIESYTLNESDVEILKNPLVGGLILFARNFQSAEQILQLTQSIRAINADIIIAVDQEGGRVQRFTHGFSRLPALAGFGRLAMTDKASAVQYATSLGELMALEVQSVGCDISFAPVLDLGLLSSQIIGNRGFSTDPQLIVELGAAYLKGMSLGGMLGTGKHFPGHGSVEADSHLEIPVDLRSLEVIEQLDLKPFAALSSSLGAVMPAHIIYPQVDEHPAGFSSVWLQKILRSQIGFDGVIFSDDLSMKGAEAAGNFAQRASKALEAGCDMVLVCNDRQAAIEVLTSLQNYPMNQLSSNRLKRLQMQRKPAGLKQLQDSTRWQTLAKQLETFNKLMEEI